MGRRSFAVSLLWLASCANASDPAPNPGQGTPPPKSADASKAAADEAKAPPTDDPCALAEARFVEVQREQNRCERDDDCAEIYPGTCPQGPYYTNVDGDHAALGAAAKAMAKACGSVECAKPMPLGIAHCEAGRCVAGRTPPEERPDESCWDTKVTYMRPGWPYLASAYEHLQGITPLHAVGVPGAGTLRISVRRDCAGCNLMVSERNLGMASLVKGRPFVPKPKDPMEVQPVTSRTPPSGPTEHLEFSVTAGPYFIATIGEKGEVQYEVELLDAAGKAMEPDRRGVVHRRICEG